MRNQDYYLPHLYILVTLFLIGKVSEFLSLNFLGTSNVDTCDFSSLGVIASHIVVALYVICVNLLNGLLYAFVFVFMGALALFTHDQVILYSWPQKKADISLSFPAVSSSYVQTKSKGSVYQVSKTGEKKDCVIYGNKPVTLTLTEEEEEKENPDASLLVRVSSFFVRVYYGHQGDKIAIVDRVVCERLSPPVMTGEEQDETAIVSSSPSLPLPFLDRSYTIHKFKEQPRSFLQNLGALVPSLKNTSEQDLMKEMQTYNAKIPTVYYRQEYEFASGHKIVKKFKMKNTLKKTSNI